MLVGRDHERAVIEQALADARAGTSRILAVRGEPGIGKTALLDTAVASATASGMQVLLCRGVESEAELPFSGLLELLRPVADRVEALPKPQLDALRHALTGGEARTPGAFSVGAATLSLLAAVAEEEPLLVCVDDVQWVDGASASALVFAARRLVADRVAILIGVRDCEPSALDDAGLPELRVPGLEPTTARALLARTRKVALEPHVTELLLGAAAGNPLALIELARTADDIAVDLFVAPVPASQRVTSSLARRLATLPAAARRSLALAAASDGGDLAVIAAAAARVELDLTMLGDAESAGLVVLDHGTVRFRHPLVRAAAYAAVTPAERRAAHAALAASLAPAEEDRRAWHAAMATVVPDEGIASALADAGTRAHHRGAFAAAATTGERAARLTPAAGTRARRLYAAADAAALAGAHVRAAGLLDEAAALVEDPSTRTDIDHLRGRIAARRGPVPEARVILVDAAHTAADRDPGRAAVMLAEAAYIGCFAGDAHRNVAIAREALALAPEADARATCLALLALGSSLVFAGCGAEAADQLRRATELIEGSEGVRSDPHIVSWTGVAPLFLRERTAARHLLYDALDHARAQGATGALPALLIHVAIDHATTDRYAEARAMYSEAILLTRETGALVALAIALSGLAIVEARQGRGTKSRRHAEEALAVSETVGDRLHVVWALSALVQLQLGEGDLSGVELDLARLRATLDEAGFRDPDIDPTPELVEVLVRSGRDHDAHQPLARFAERASQKGQPWALARLERARGLLASEDEFAETFARALILHARTEDTFEQARTLLAFGERLRRAGRRVLAREQLRSAFAAFERLGAEPWITRARLELRATGERARRRNAATLDDLTPQELQIALLLAAGATTREAAGRLFLSPKTIEYHLHHVYGKLGVRSRSALAEALETALPANTAAISSAARAAPSSGTPA